MDNPNLTQQDKSNKLILSTGIGLAILLPLVLSFLNRYAGIDYQQKVYYSLLIDWGTIVVLYVYALKIEKSPLLIVTDNETGIGFIIVSVLVLYVLYVLVAVVSSIPWWFGYRENDQIFFKILRLMRGHPVLVFFVSITAGVTEEIIFRGYVLTRLALYFKKPSVAVIVSSVIFSALHYGYHSLIEFIFTFLLGTVFSIYYLRYRNIHALIIVHSLIDFIIFNSAHSTFF